METGPGWPAVGEGERGSAVKMGQSVPDSSLQLPHEATGEAPAWHLPRGESEAGLSGRGRGLDPTAAVLTEVPFS